MIHIYNLEYNTLVGELKKLGIPKFRASQIWNFLYIQKKQSFDQMHTLPKSLISTLKEEFVIQTAVEKIRQKSKDKTQKVLLTLEDGQDIETVLMKYKHGYSVCVTTQVGCKIGCSFCASHLGGFTRNLTTGEIVEQVMYWEQILKVIDEKVDNIVVMGIGEPFDNLENVFGFINIINYEKGLNIGARKITVSTSGIMSKMDEFIGYPKQINLAISLHAATDEKRTKIMKINNVYNIKSIMRGVQKYLVSKNRQVTFEYIMLRGINDTKEDALALVKLIGDLNIFVNLIPYNSVQEYEYQKTIDKKVREFEKILITNKINVSTRQQKGSDIDGACGQLRRKGKR